MALLDFLRGTRTNVRPDFLAGPNPAANAGILSPWSDGELNKFVWSDIFGVEYAPVTRMEALSIPAVAGGVNRIVGELANRSLRCLDGAGLLKTQPSWLSRTDTGVSPYHRMVGILNDHIFDGDSLLSVKRGSDGKTILDAVHIPHWRWRIDPDTFEFLVVEQPVQAGSVVYLPCSFPGLLNIASEKVRAAKNLERAVSNRLRNPTPTVLLEQQDDSELTKEEVQDYVKAVAAARRDPDGPVMFTPKSIRASFHGDSAPDLFENERNQLRLDIANFLNLDPDAIAGSKNASTLKYETDGSQQTALANRLTFWTAPIEAALSMDDVVPRGQRVRFDFGTSPTAPGGDTGPFSED